MAGVLNEKELRQLQTTQAVETPASNGGYAAAQGLCGGCGERTTTSHPGVQ